MRREILNLIDPLSSYSILSYVLTTRLAWDPSIIDAMLLFF
jgi:hypothetical protein